MTRTEFSLHLFSSIFRVYLQQIIHVFLLIQCKLNMNFHCFIYIYIYIYIYIVFDKYSVNLFLYIYIIYIHIYIPTYIKFVYYNPQMHADHFLLLLSLIVLLHILQIPHCSQNTLRCFHTKTFNKLSKWQIRRQETTYFKQIQNISKCARTSQ